LVVAYLIVFSCQSSKKTKKIKTAVQVKGIFCSYPTSHVGETVMASVLDIFLLHFKLLIEGPGEKIVTISPKALW
jgi:hypothetical protein